MPGIRNNPICSSIYSLWVYVVKLVAEVRGRGMADGETEEHQNGVEITTQQQIEITIPETGFQQDHSLPTETMTTQAETFKIGLKVAIWATAISASGVTAVFTGLLINQTYTPSSKPFAKATLLSMCASFVSGLFIFILSFIRLESEATAAILKVLMFTASASTTLVVGFGVAFYFQMA